MMLDIYQYRGMIYASLVLLYIVYVKVGGSGAGVEVSGEGG